MDPGLLDDGSTPHLALIVKQVLFIQGAGRGTHAKWDIKLVESLRRELGPGYEVRYPRMPNEAAPKFASWQRALEKEFAALHSGAAVVGHSVGGATMIHAIAKQPLRVELGAIAIDDLRRELKTSSSENLTA